MKTSSGRGYFKKQFPRNVHSVSTQFPAVMKARRPGPAQRRRPNAVSASSARGVAPERPQGRLWPPAPQALNQPTRNQVSRSHGRPSPKHFNPLCRVELGQAWHPGLSARPLGAPRPSQALPPWLLDSRQHPHLERISPARTPHPYQLLPRTQRQRHLSEATSASLWVHGHSQHRAVLTMCPCLWPPTGPWSAGPGPNTWGHTHLPTGGQREQQEVSGRPRWV